MLNSIMCGGGVLLAGVIFVAVLVERVDGQDIGNCNLTAFTTGGQLCQRNMMSALKNNSNLNCSDEYAKQTICLTSHVGSCVTGTSLSFADGEIVKLLSLLLYHCGKLGFDVGNINEIVLGVAQCKKEELSKIVTCWDDFRTAFNANRSDPSLCRKFAEGKQRCTNIARESCAGICEYISKDEYNPFCSNNMDPPGTSNLFDCIRSLGCSNTVAYENAVKCEKLSFEDFAKSSVQNCSIELKKNKDCLRQNLVSKCTAMQKKDEIVEDVVKVFRATLMTQQFFCEKVTLDQASLHRSVKTLVNCKQEFFTTVETCAERFRKTYAEGDEKKTCDAFSDAKKCLNKAHEDFCMFDAITLKAAMFDDDNPFCEGGKDIQRKSGVSRAAQATSIMLFISSIAVFLGIP